MEQNQNQSKFIGCLIYDYSMWIFDQWDSTVGLLCHVWINWKSWNNCSNPDCLYCHRKKSDICVQTVWSLFIGTCVAIVMIYSKHQHEHKRHKTVVVIIETEYGKMEILPLLTFIHLWFLATVLNIWTYASKSLLCFIYSCFWTTHSF